MMVHAAMQLTGLDEISSACRRRFHEEHLSALPDPFASAIETVFRQRIIRANGKAMLGECAPWLLSSILPLKDVGSAIERIAMPWMHLYVFTLIIDDLIDQSETSDKMTALLGANLLLERGLMALLAEIPPSAHIRLRIDQAFTEAAMAVLTEVSEHRNRIESYSEAEIESLGSKVALLKVCALSLLGADGQSQPSEELLAPVHALATGMQLLDDVSDWEEDWRIGQLSPVLTGALSFLSKEGECTTKDSKVVFGSMLLSGSLEKCIRTGLKCLNQVRSAPTLNRKSSASQLLAGVSGEYEHFLQEAVRNRGICEERLSASPATTTLERLSRLAESEEGKLLLDPLQERIKIIAQNS